MDRITQITKMENHLNEATAAVMEFAKALERFEKCQSKIKKLSDYYGSEAWFQDLEEYVRGRLPEDLKCGVLSEDAVYNVLVDNRELAIKMLELGTAIIKK